MIRVELYTRPGCHLCEVARAVLEDARRRTPFELLERDVESDPAWEAAYGANIPVIVIDGEKAFQHRIDRRELERRLARAGR